VSNKRVINGWWIRKTLEGNGHGLFYGPIPAFAWIGWGKPRKPSVITTSRPRGRPRNSYKDGIEEIGRRKGKSLREMWRLAVDRGRWKELVEAPLTLWGTMGKRKKKKNSQSADRDLNFGVSEYEAGGLATRPRRLVPSVLKEGLKKTTKSLTRDSRLSVELVSYGLISCTLHEFVKLTHNGEDVPVSFSVILFHIQSNRTDFGWIWYLAWTLEVV
jgi:hypothetical protein